MELPWRLPCRTKNRVYTRWVGSVMVCKADGRREAVTSDSWAKQTER